MNDTKLFIRKKGDDGTKTFSIRIKQETVDRIDELSKKLTGAEMNLLECFLILD